MTLRSSSMHQRRGIVFVLTLAALTAIVLSVALYAQNQRETVQVTINRNELRRARIAAEAGIQRAMTELQTVADAPETAVTLEDEWALLGNTGADNFIIGRDSFRLQIIDESSKIDLNTVPETQLLQLNLTQEQVDSFLDWREAGLTARTEGGKDEYYNGLTKRYNARLGRLQSVNEILLIKSFTPRVLFFPPENTVNTSRVAGQEPSALIDLVGIDCFSSTAAPDGSGKVNLNNQQLNAQQLSQNAQIPLAQATAIIQAKAAQPNGNFTALSQVLLVPGIQGNQQVIRNVLDRMTIATTARIEGKINVNTCTSEVLATIPNVTPDIADSIVDNRPSGGYQTLGDLLTANSEPTFLQAAADYLTTTSQSFRVRSVGKAGTMTYILEALVTLDNTIPRILRIERPAFADMPSRWQWADATNEITLLESQ